MVVSRWYGREGLVETNIWELRPKNGVGNICRRDSMSVGGRVRGAVGGGVGGRERVLRLPRGRRRALAPGGPARAAPQQLPPAGRRARAARKRLQLEGRGAAESEAATQRLAADSPTRQTEEKRNARPVERSVFHANVAKGEGFGKKEINSRRSSLLDKRQRCPCRIRANPS
ncbi:Protein of unknown function [Gryllus bimaculatus]|nr:Protein of unknown function [Gryllus bimaculatus]